MARHMSKPSHAMRHMGEEGQTSSRMEHLRRPIETPYGTFESILAASQYTGKSLGRIRDRLKYNKPGWRYVTA